MTCRPSAKITSLARVGKLVLSDEVSPPHLEAVEAKLAGELVHGALDGVAGMRPAAAAIGGHLHGRHVDGAEGDPKVRNAIGAGYRGRAHLGDGDSVGNERTCIVQEVVLQADHPAILHGCELEGVDLRPFLGRADEVLDPVLDVLDRAPKLHRCLWNQEFVGVEHHDLLAEAAAHVGRNHAYLVLIDLEHGGQGATHRQRRLRAVPDRELAGHSLPARRNGAAFHRRGRAAARGES